MSNFVATDVYALFNIYVKKLAQPKKNSTDISAVSARFSISGTIMSNFVATDVYALFNIYVEKSAT